MKQILAIIVLIAVMIGCNGTDTDSVDQQQQTPQVQGPTQEQEQAPAPAKQPETEQQPNEEELEQISEPEPAQDPEPETEPETCESTLESHQISEIVMSLDEDPKNYITRTSEGFTFRFYPLDSSGNDIIPVTGNLAVQVLTTTINTKGELEPDTTLYKRSFYIKESDVMTDCGPQPITINFADIEAEDDYRFVQEDDNGMLKLEFKTTGGQPYPFEFKAYEHDISVLP